jgi:predicted metal-dependent hydrolase
MANLLEGWDKIRRWIDNESDDALITENIQKAHDNKSESELFMLRLLNEVEAVLKREIVRIPNTNRAYAPEKFVVYLSEETDKNLRRDKREFFEQNLSALIFERAKELAGKLQLTAKKMTVEIATDPTLEEDIEVRAAARNEFETVRTEALAAGLPQSGNTIDDYATIIDAKAELGILYRVEIWQGNRRINEYPIIQKKNTIGREDGQKAANLRLPSENRKISRFHAEIELEENGEIWVKALHKNPTVVSGQVIRSGERAKLGADGEIMIYDFTLKLKFEK